MTESGVKQRVGRGAEGGVKREGKIHAETNNAAGESKRQEAVMD